MTTTSNKRTSSNGVPQALNVCNNSSIPDISPFLRKRFSLALRPGHQLPIRQYILRPTPSGLNLGARLTPTLLKSYTPTIQGSSSSHITADSLLYHQPDDSFTQLVICTDSQHALSVLQGDALPTTHHQLVTLAQKYSAIRCKSSKSPLI